MGAMGVPPRSALRSVKSSSVETRVSVEREPRRRPIYARNSPRITITPICLSANLPLWMKRSEASVSTMLLNWSKLLRRGGNEEVERR